MRLMLLSRYVDFLTDYCKINILLFKIGYIIRQIVYKHLYAGKIFAECVLNSVATYWRRLCIISNYFNTVFVGKIYGSLIMIFL